MNHISTVRQHLLDQMAALRAAPHESVKLELERSKGMSDLAQTAVAIAKVEVDYLVATGQESLLFLEIPAEKKYIAAGDEGAHLPNGISSITRHRIGS